MLPYFGTPEFTGPAKEALKFSLFIPRESVYESEQDTMTYNKNIFR